MAGGINSSVLLGWYQSFFAGRGTGVAANTSNNSSTGGTTSSAPQILYAPTPPWQGAQPSQTQLVKSALNGVNFFNSSAAKLDLPGASADYKSLFALYSGLNTLYSLASQASKSHVTSAQLSQYQTAFANGMGQLSTFLSNTSFAKLKLATGTIQSSQTSSVATPSQASVYTTAPLNTSGDSSAVVPAFSGNVSFDVTVKLGSTNTVVPINLSGMGATPRTMGNVVSYMNGQLSAAGVFVSFSVDRLPAQPDTITVGNKTVTVSSGNQSWALQLNTNPAETVTLSAPTTGAAVYLGQIVGNQSSSTGPTGATVPADAQSQLLKFNASGDGVTGAVKPAFAASDQISTTALGPTVNAIRATATAADGSVYVLANVNATTTGATPAGGQDVALMKYDSAGHLVFTTDLGSASSAGGLSLALSADGSQVAVAGQVTGSLVAGQTVNDPTGSDTFVAVYDSLGDKIWSQQDDGATPNHAGGVAFGANGDVYVTGQAQTATGAGGPTDSYLQVFDTSGVEVANTTIASGGTNTGNGVAVSGNDVYVAGVQNGQAVVSEYDMTNPAAPALIATRNLGNLDGGGVAGVAVSGNTVYVAGEAHNGALSAGTVTSASTGTGLNAFAATLSTGLAPSASDAVAYYGGSGDTNATAMTVANGEVWITGSVTGSLPGEAAIGTQDGYVAALNVGAGTVGYAQRFTGQDGEVAPTSIAVAPSGESVLDQLGLPNGVVDGPVSDLVTSTTPVRAGDSFQIAVNGGAPITIAVQATDTMASLASEISQATGFIADVTTAPAANGSVALEIKPAYPGAKVTLIDGPSGSDALKGLGLSPGVVADTTATKAGVRELSGTPIYGLGLPASLDLSSAADINTAKVQLAGAISVVEKAYQDLANAATPAAVLALRKAQASGGAPKYLTAQIANYQSALARLTGGQNSSSPTGLSALF
ncbi:MAG: beta strand repeat-containing protein [Caulobacteraceae bacterium]